MLILFCLVKKNHNSLGGVKVLLHTAKSYSIISVMLGLLLVGFSESPAQTLQPYRCITERLLLEGFTDSALSTLTKDETGIIYHKKGYYHPSRIALYGILCLDRFVQTGDSSYFFYAKDQLPYYKDTSLVDLVFEDRGIGLPYHFPAHDLQPVWYSGLAQGFSISFLLRHFEVSQDSSLLPIVQKLAYFLRQPVEQGGTISTFEDGSHWIEEYPNSKWKPAVLNGGIAGLIGLKEYTLFFPEDSAALEVYTDCLNWLIANLGHYNMKDWSWYDYSHKRVSQPVYHHYHVYQMRDLYTLTGEEIFRRQMLLWAAFASYRSIESKNPIFLNKNHTLSVESRTSGTNWAEPQLSLQPLTDGKIIRARLDSFTSLQGVTDHLNGRHTQIQPRKRPSFLLISMNKAVDLDYLTFSFYSKLPPADYIVYAYNAENGKLESVPMEYSLLSASELRMMAPLTQVQYLVLELRSKSPLPYLKPRIGLYNTAHIKLPWAVHNVSIDIPIDKQTRYSVNIPGNDVHDAVIFWKYDKDPVTVREKPWHPDQYVKGNTISALADGVINLLVVYPYHKPWSSIGRIKLKKIQ